MPSAKSADVAFWDSSGIVLLCAQQRATHDARRLVRAHGRIACWWGTPVEVRSAFVRLMREGALTTAEAAACSARLTVVHRAAVEVLPSEELRAVAESVIDRFDVHAADAFQLAAALVLCHGKPRRRPFVCFDRRLASAAALAGFEALPAAK